MIIKLVILIIMVICGLGAVYCGIKVSRISNQKGTNQLKDKKNGYGKTWVDEP